MYHLSKRMEIAGSHHLDLDYESPCQNVHGHNWIVVVEVEGEHLNQNGMLIDFKRIKEVGGILDHSNLNETLVLNPTAENIAKWIAEAVQSIILADLGEAITVAPKVTKVTVQESEGNVVWYTP